MDISIIIPVLHEAEVINDLVAHVRGLSAPGGVEVLVVDGARHRDTLAVLDADSARGLSSPRGRARQMNEGAFAASGDAVLFLHADTRLPDNALHHVAGTLADPEVVGGAFDFEFLDPAGPVLWLIAATARLRSRLTRAPYGDQAQFFRRSYFIQRGGYREWPLMEDLELMTRIRRRGDSIRIVPERVRTSARRFEREGLVACTLRNWWLRLRYHLGASPHSLAKQYRFSPPGPTREILLFVKYPSPGQVKTRLGSEIGDAVAARLYKAFVADELAVCARHGARLVVCCDPSQPLTRYRDWLGPDVLLREQRGNGLGQRMARAFDDAFKKGVEQVALVGSDVPQLTRQVLVHAFESLAKTGATLAPSGDGGYSLIAFTQEAFNPIVFSEIEWSTDRVWTQTLEAFEPLGIAPVQLSLLPDVDTVTDLHRLFEADMNHAPQTSKILSELDEFNGFHRAK